MIDDISPCVGICKLDKKGELCTGCSRTIDDIRNWNNYSLRKKKKIMDSLKK
tara:strand:- start:1232 stop:1387 length:156 start_codon:yes stop_codon:yes gene_type:complete